jgi:hypothetical protein
MNLAIADYQWDIVPERITIYKKYKYLLEWYNNRESWIEDDSVSKYFDEGADIYLVH